MIKKMSPEIEKRLWDAADELRTYSDLTGAYLSTTEK